MPRTPRDKLTINAAVMAPNKNQQRAKLGIDRRISIRCLQLAEIATPSLTASRSMFPTRSRIARSCGRCRSMHSRGRRRGGLRYNYGIEILSGRIVPLESIRSSWRIANLLTARSRWNFRLLLTSRLPWEPAINHRNFNKALTNLAKQNVYSCEAVSRHFNIPVEFKFAWNKLFITFNNLLHLISRDLKCEINRRSVDDHYKSFIVIYWLDFIFRSINKVLLCSCVLDISIYMVHCQNTHF